MKSFIKTTNESRIKNDQDCPKVFFSFLRVYQILGLTGGGAFSDFFFDKILRVPTIWPWGPQLLETPLLPLVRVILFSG